MRRNRDRAALASARKDLSACLRAAAALGLHEGVCTRVSHAAPPEAAGGRSDLFLANPRGLSFAEVTPGIAARATADIAAGQPAAAGLHLAGIRRRLAAAEAADFR
ncbi:MAG: hypothetical protein NZM27_06730 [Acetobacteraceae bacterium]|nr:hypothetical protein [Acetobacteraceae bacterium]MDW8398600.1 hypothetical protein [Acetobacteraceae bacterium]